MLPGFASLSNFNAGFVYNFGKKYSLTTYSLSYSPSLDLTEDDVLNGTFQVRSAHFHKGPSRGTSNAEVVLGGGYRRKLGPLGAGISGFQRFLRIQSEWFGSQGLTVELFGGLTGGGSYDVSFSMYGVLNSGPGHLLNTLKGEPGNWLVEAGYTQPVLSGGTTIRLKYAGYQFQYAPGLFNRGWNGGATLSLQNGIVSIAYDGGFDPGSDVYHNISVNLNLGFDAGELLGGANPFTEP